MTNTPVPCSAQFTHQGQQWKVTCSLYCGVYRVIVQCEGIEVDKRIIAPTREMNVVVGDVILEMFGKEYGLR